MMRSGALLLAAFTTAVANDRGGIAGLVQDTSGAVLVAANVTAMDQDSGIRRLT